MRLGYTLTSRDGAHVEFEETYELPASLGPLAPASDEAVGRALLGLHLAAGTSYWKTRIPRELWVEDASISADDAQFWSAVYTQGLGEFFYRNQIDPTGRASFRETSGADRHKAAAHPAPGPSLLLWGGGKDSVVSHEILEAAGEAHDLLSVGRTDWEWVHSSAAVSGRVLHVVSRRLDPKLLEMNSTDQRY